MMAQFSITIGPPKKHKQILTVAVSICLLCVYVCLEVSQSKEKGEKTPHNQYPKLSRPKINLFSSQRTPGSLFYSKFRDVTIDRM